jgi:hypothetical protein
MLYGSFHAISCNSWWLKMSISDCQHFAGLEIKARVMCVSHSGWGRTPILLVHTWMVGRHTDRHRLVVLSCPCRSMRGWCLSLRGYHLSPCRVCGAYLSFVKVSVLDRTWSLLILPEGQNGGEVVRWKEEKEVMIDLATWCLAQGLCSLGELQLLGFC